MTPSSPSPLAAAETHGAAPAEKHGAACPAPGGGCRQLHCGVCTAHLANPHQRFCSPRCRTRARALRKVLVYCSQCGARRWLTHRPAKSRMG